MIDTGYNMFKDLTNLIVKQKKKYDKDGYIEILEEQLEDQAKKYDELMEEYKKIIEQEDNTIVFGKLHYEILSEIKKSGEVECAGYLEHINNKNIDYEIALEEIVRKKYVRKHKISNKMDICFFGNKPPQKSRNLLWDCFQIDPLHKLDVLAFLKDYESK